jgi:hypothetical protein
MGNEDDQKSPPEEKDIHADSRRLAIRSLESARGSVKMVENLGQHGFDVTPTDVEEITTRIDRLIEKIRRK